MNILPIRYIFSPVHQHDIVFQFNINEENMELLPAMDAAPLWAGLEFHQCKNCPLALSTYRYCPLAKALAPIVHGFERLHSYDDVHVIVTVPERTIIADTTVQRALSSLYGLLIAVCGCPNSAFLKPMARFHLPFSTEKETIYRATSMYLLAQYFCKREGFKVDIELQGLRERYHRLHVVNRSVARRLRSACKTDSSLNAIVILDILAQIVPDVVNHSLDELHHLFTGYLGRPSDQTPYPPKSP